MHAIKFFKIYRCLFGMVVLLMLMSQGAASCQQVTAVSSKEFFENYMHLFEDSSAIVIDGRTEKMFSEGCLGNAINIDADDPDLIELLQPFLNYPMIVLYCTTIRRTNDIMQVLKELYKGDIVYISDGIRGWRANGFSVQGETLKEPVPVSVALPDTLIGPQ